MTSSVGLVGPASTAILTALVVVTDRARMRQMSRALYAPSIGRIAP